LSLRMLRHGAPPAMRTMRRMDEFFAGGLRFPA
jgi:hypothetical protein